MKLKGKVAFRDVETGVWVLEGDDGRVYQLAGGDRNIKKDGSRIESEYVNLGALRLRGTTPQGRVDLPWQELESVRFER